ncbi:hypothetical protein BC628DRAFT_1374355 [Trametes gibbosa]|nr:hypothetical protein BC628DRAFT_1374355 [Trametes gibbosa]
MCKHSSMWVLTCLWPSPEFAVDRCAAGFSEQAKRGGGHRRESALYVEGARLQPSGTIIAQGQRLVRTSTAMYERYMSWGCSVFAATAVDELVDGFDYPHGKGKRCRRVGVRMESDRGLGCWEDGRCAEQHYTVSDVTSPQTQSDVGQRRRAITTSVPVDERNSLSHRQSAYVAWCLCVEHDRHQYFPHFDKLGILHNCTSVSSLTPPKFLK